MKARACCFPSARASGSSCENEAKIKPGMMIAGLCAARLHLAAHKFRENPSSYDPQIAGTPGYLTASDLLNPCINHL